MLKKQFHRIGVLWAIAAGILPSVASAQLTEEDFRRSLSENIDQTIDPNKFLAFFLCLIAGVIVIAVIQKRRAARPATNKALNHPGKLMKEVGKLVQLRPAELKQLRNLAPLENVNNPLVLLMCPSVLARAVKNVNARFDRHIVGGLARKLTRK